MVTAMSSVTKVANPDAPAATKAIRLAALLGGIVAASLLVNTVTIFVDGKVRQRTSTAPSIANDIGNLQPPPHPLKEANAPVVSGAF